MKQTLWLFCRSNDGDSTVLHTLEAEEGDRLSDVIRRGGFDFLSPCGGRGRCGQCRVEAARISGALPAELASEKSLTFDAIRKLAAPKPILACQTAVSGNMLILLPESFRVSGTLTGKILAGGAPVHKKSAPSDGPLTVGIDLGTTTIAAALRDQKSDVLLAETTALNPQSAFGADVVSRIEYAGRSPESLQKLRDLVVLRLDQMIRELAEHAEVPAERIRRVAVAGNTVMEYLLLGLDPEPLGRSPFEPPLLKFAPTTGRAIRFDSVPNAAVEVFPVISGFIGGDLAAGAAALGLAAPKGLFQRFLRPKEPELLIDIGTNGEMLLFHGERIFAASTAAGPVFEGAHIRFGSFAVPGAIEGVDFAPVPYWEKEARVKPSDLFIPQPSLHTVGGGQPSGICGSGLVDAVAELLRLGLLTPNGRLADASGAAGKRERGRLGKFEKERAFLLAGQSAGISRPVWVTQGDIRQVQLAVGAIRAGLTILLQRAGIEPGGLAAIRLAGGFGSSLRRENARRIGLLPSETPIERIQYCGNTSLAGALAAAVDPAVLKRAAELRARTEYVELATATEFAPLFAESMIFPEQSKE